MLRNLVGSLLLCAYALSAQAVRFAEDGALKMLYDNRMYPQAVESRGELFIVWRGDGGLPWIRSYNLAKRTFSPAWMLLEGMDVEIDAERFESDQHLSPVIWAEADGLLHVAFGFHGTPGYHFVSKAPGSVTEWEGRPEISASISYPKIHRLADGKTLVYFRESGHLGFWTYRLSANGGRTWSRPGEPLIDMNAPPHDALMASHAGSYQTTRLSEDGRTLHVAFIWKVEEPVRSERYDQVLHDYTRRHNLYYLRVDLETGQAYNLAGKKLARPINKGVADRDCLVWDTHGRPASVGPSIALGDHDEPYLLLPVSGDTPYAGKFYFVRPHDGEWVRTPLTTSSHPFNSSHLERKADGSFRAYLIAGEGESMADDEMNRYGWGDRIEEWVSDSEGENWRRTRDLTPKPGERYQNIQFVRGEKDETVNGLLLFYGWEGQGKGRAYLLDERE